MTKRNRLILFGVVFLFLITSTYAVVNNHNSSVQIQTNNNTDSNQTEHILQEYNMYCPFCGSSVIAVNYNIVCRNTECEMYGLPVCVSKCVDGMDNHDEDNQIGK